MNTVNKNPNWDKVVNKIHNVPDWAKLKRFPVQYQEVVYLREFLLFCQLFLNKIEMGEDVILNTSLFRETIAFYCEQMKKYA